MGGAMLFQRLCSPRQLMYDLLTKMYASAGPIGPSTTVATILLVAYIGTKVFSNTDDPISLYIKSIAASLGAAATFFCVICYLTDPGAPRADSSDPRPLDPFDDAVRIRERCLPDG